MSDEIGINKTELLDTVLHITVTALEFRVWCQIQQQSIIMLQNNLLQGLSRKNDLIMETGALQGILVSLAPTENGASFNSGPCCWSAQALIQPSALSLHLH